MGAWLGTGCSHVDCLYVGHGCWDVLFMLCGRERRARERTEESRAERGEKEV